ncbi:restriction endonuclease subunit S [Enterococcus raffinosus]|uniref:restriction endonuclease subunit S n=1 Tax=Enterococcus raffinosus TaxID=71452 RepID=UPI0028902373|nr:restriction endonuclease subunit S [Enterococcus raffinosus]EMF0257571.1 restriction endonuclease subunit S [Enterococcus hirae]MDT2525523.1 restriction endonuclease subunit S [Enterococcus raffinosus]
MTPEQLKASILQRAMEGKLVPQDPNDEPASELLKRIKAEKEKLIKEGKIKRDKNETEIYRGDDGLHYEKFADGTVKEVNVPFDIPESWEWVRFSEVSTIVRGGSPRPIKEFITEADDGINWIKIGDTDKGGKFINSTKEKIKSSGLKKTRYVTKGTFLLTNSMSFGRPYILNVDGAIHDGWLAISNYEEVFSRDFLYYLLSSKVAYHQFLALISGAVVKNLNSDKVASLLVPVPPQKEQERIVSAIMVGLPKVDDYQKLHDRLEKINKELPEKLRKSILQYAMQGKLVPQDPNDEPVEVLLEKIRQEKQKLFEEGKLKKKDLQESIIYKGDDNSYYEKSGKMAHKIDVPHDDLPANWKWSRLSQLGILIRGSGIKKNETTAEGIGCVRYGELYTTYDYFFTSTKSFTTRKVAEKSKEIATSDILMTLTGENKEDIGKATVYLGEEKIVMGGDLTKLTGHNMNPVFLSLLLNSPQIISQKSSVATGNIIVHISNDKLGKMLVPVPPLPEQAKIVTQVEGLNLQISQLPE